MKSRPCVPSVRDSTGLLGKGAAAFRASFDLLPDPVGVLWAVRDASGAVIDFETGYANQAMARMFGVSIERTFGRRVVEETPAFRDDETFKKLRQVIETGTLAVVETVVERAGPIGPLAGTSAYRCIPLGPDAVLNLVTDLTAQRRLETELERYAKVAAHDLREPLTATAKRGTHPGHTRQFAKTENPDLRGL